MAAFTSIRGFLSLFPGTAPFAAPGAARAPRSRPAARKHCCLGVLGLLLATPAARADIFDDYDTTRRIFDEPDDTLHSVDLQADLGVFSDRLFRGQRLSHAVSFEPRVRGQVNFPVASVYLEAFGHLSGESAEDESHTLAEFEGSHTAHFAELGYDLGVTKTIEFVTVRAGHRWYSYDKETARLDNSGEFFGRVQADIIAHPYLELDFDWDAYRGHYGEFGLEQPIPIDLPRERIELVPFTRLSYSSGLADSPKPIYADDGFVAFETGVRVDLLVAENIYLQPLVQFTEGLDSNADSLFTAGIRIGARLGIP